MRMPEYESYQESLLEIQRLAGIGVISAGVAHDLINPINIITTSCNNLLSQLADDNLSTDDLLRYMGMIDQNAWRCAQIVKALRDYSYMNGSNSSQQLSDASGFDSYELNSIVERTLILVSYEIERQYNIKISSRLEPDLAPLVCDQNQITQVLINLLINARDAMPAAGGQICVSTWQLPDEQAQGFSVSDTGMGIDPAILPTIFDPFVTTKPMGVGTGLGLAISKQIVDSHHGRIAARNDEEGGATFTIVLPTEQ